MAEKLLGCSICKLAGNLSSGICHAFRVPEKVFLGRQLMGDTIKLPEVGYRKLLLATVHCRNQVMEKPVLQDPNAGETVYTVGAGS